MYKIYIKIFPTTCFLFYNCIKGVFNVIFVSWNKFISITTIVKTILFFYLIIRVVDSINYWIYSNVQDLLRSSTRCVVNMQPGENKTSYIVSDGYTCVDSFDVCQQALHAWPRNPKYSDLVKWTQLVSWVIGARPYPALSTAPTAQLPLSKAPHCTALTQNSSHSAELPLSTAATQYSSHSVQLPLSTAPTQYSSPLHSSHSAQIPTAQLPHFTAPTAQLVLCPAPTALFFSELVELGYMIFHF